MVEAMASATINVGRRPRRSLLEPIVMAVTLGLIVLFSLTIKGFATLGNLSVILSNSTSLVILSCGMAVVIISRGLDLSQVAAMVAGATTFSALINAGFSVVSAVECAILRRQARRPLPPSPDPEGPANKPRPRLVPQPRFDRRKES
jgi:ribose transport system permease protein